MILRVIDIETTGMEPPAEVIEVGWWDVVVEETARVGIHQGGTADFDCGTRLFSATHLPPESMAVHHITPEMLEGLPPCDSNALAEITTNLSPSALVAHNASFEALFISDEARAGLPFICTYKAALRVWPDAPAHTNQVLRYWLNLALDSALAMPPHRAQPDAYVTAHILVELLKHATIENMIAWTNEPRVMPRITFGKHRGKKWGEVPADYLDWILSRPDFDEDTRWNARRELELRRQAK